MVRPLGRPPGRGTEGNHSPPEWTNLPNPGVHQPEPGRAGSERGLNGRLNRLSASVTAKTRRQMTRQRRRPCSPALSSPPTPLRQIHTLGHHPAPVRPLTTGQGRDTSGCGGRIPLLLWVRRGARGLVGVFLSGFLWLSARAVLPPARYISMGDGINSSRWQLHQMMGGTSKRPQPTPQVHQIPGPVAERWNMPVIPRRGISEAPVNNAE